jgi:DNA invertase Pin-like site-specific DNA recombinase
MAGSKEAGCKKLFEEAASGGRWDRPELHRLLDQLRPGDTLVVWKLDRLSRSLKDLLTILECIDLAGAKFRSVTRYLRPCWSRADADAGAFAEFEREMIRERTRAARARRGPMAAYGGARPRSPHEQKKEIVEAVASGRKTPAEIARLFKIHPATISRVLAQARVGV